MCFRSISYFEWWNLNFYITNPELIFKKTEFKIALLLFISHGKYVFLKFNIFCIKWLFIIKIEEFVSLRSEINSRWFISCFTWSSPFLSISLVVRGFKHSNSKGIRRIHRCFDIVSIILVVLWISSKREEKEATYSGRKDGCRRNERCGRPGVNILHTWRLNTQNFYNHKHRENNAVLCEQSRKIRGDGNCFTETIYCFRNQSFSLFWSTEDGIWGCQSHSVEFRPWDLWRMQRGHSHLYLPRLSSRIIHKACSGCHPRRKPEQTICFSISK